MDVHRYTGQTERLAQAIDEDRARPPADGAAAGRAPLPGRAGPARRPDDHRRRAWARTPPCGCGRTCCRRPRCRSTTPATWRSSPARRPRARLCSTWWWGRSRCTAAAGWRARAPSTPRTRRCAGCDLVGLPAEGRAAVSCRAAPTGNLSALVAARHAALERRGGERPARWSVAITDETPLRRGYALSNVMDVDTLMVPADERGRMTGDGARGGARGGRRRARVRGRGNGRHHQRGRGRRPGRRGRRLQGARAVDARGRRLRRCGAGGAVGAPPVRRRRARRQLHRRSPQVAVRPFDCCALVYRDPRSPAAPTPSTPATSTWSTSRASGTRPTTRCTSPGAPAACRSGSRWQPTAATPTATRSSRRWRWRGRRAGDPQSQLPRAAGRARPLGADLPPRRLGRRGLRGVERPAAGRGLRVRHAQTHRGEPCTRFAIVNPRTTVSDLTGILATMA